MRQNDEIEYDEKIQVRLSGVKPATFTYVMVDFIVFNLPYDLFIKPGKCRNDDNESTGFVTGMTVCKEMTI